MAEGASHADEPSADALVSNAHALQGARALRTSASALSLSPWLRGPCPRRGIAATNKKDRKEKWRGAVSTHHFFHVTPIFSNPKSSCVLSSPAGAKKQRGMRVDQRQRKSKRAPTLPPSLLLPFFLFPSLPCLAWPKAHPTRTNQAQTHWLATLTPCKGHEHCEPVRLR